MTLTEEHFKLATLFVVIAVPTTLGIVASYKKNNTKIIQHDERIYGHDEDFEHVNEKIEAMREQHGKDIEGIHEKLEKLNDKNSKQHEKLFELSNSTNVMVAELNGYMIAKKEK